MCLLLTLLNKPEKDNNNNNQIFFTLKYEVLKFKLVKPTWANV